MEKIYNIQHNIGKAKYVLNFHDGKTLHNDGSPFFKILIFSNKKILRQVEKQIQSVGYKCK